MSEKKSVLLVFDKFSFPISYADLEEFIGDEIYRLSKVTGYSIAGMTIEFKENDEDSTIAYFSHTDTEPIGFCFNLNKFDRTSPNKIIDVCRHEFAHFMVFMQNIGNLPDDCHGPEWMKMCLALGAIPSAFLKNNFTRHLVRTSSKH